jgi:hypothetical protein
VKTDIYPVYHEAPDGEYENVEQVEACGHWLIGSERVNDLSFGNNDDQPCNGSEGGLHKDPLKRFRFVRQPFVK